MAGFGIDVRWIQEILPYHVITSVPLAPESVSGLINVRGSILTALDLRRPLSFPRRVPDQPPMNIVVRDSDEAISLLIDRIGDVITVEEGSFEPPPETLADSVRKLILGAYKLSDRLVLALDISKIIHANNILTS